MMGLLKTARFVNRPIQVSIHKALNSSHGVICYCELSGMTETEIKMELQEQSVVQVPRVTEKDSEKVHTTTLFLTFSTPDLLKEVMVGHLKVKAALFVPNPMRCFNCKYGHTSQHCKVAAKCLGCEKVKHQGQCEDASCARIAMVPMLHRIKIARFGRRRRFKMSTLRNAYPNQVRDSWFKPRCRLRSLDARPTLLLLPESLDLLNATHL